jgi:ribonuclease R
MMGERTGRRYRLGDKVRIRVVSVDIETSRIDFGLVEEGVPGTAAKPRGAKRK